MACDLIANGFADRLATKGLWDAVAYLNSTTEYRFTGIYQFVDSLLHNIVLFDRENRVVRSAPDVPASLSYCSLMIESGEPFQLEDATSDSRTAAHPSKEAVQAYCGIPLMDVHGNVLGSLCHFSEVPTLVFDEDLEVLLLLPRIIRDSGHSLS